MNRRLYFLFPSPRQTLGAVDDLVRSGISLRHMYALARDGVDLTGLPSNTSNPCHGLRKRLSWKLWRSELIIFALAFNWLLAAMFMGSWLSASLALLILLLTFASSAFYAIHAPEQTIDRHRAALAHNEVMLMVDVPRSRVTQAKELVHRYHPVAKHSGNTRIFDALGI